MMKKIFISLAVIVISLCNIQAVFAQEETASGKNSVQQRVKQEVPEESTYFLIGAYKPNYFLPFYYNGSPVYPVSTNNQLDKRALRHIEGKFQISFKFPLWSKIFNYPSTLYLAYTQQSFWQAYTHSPFFRETNYEPELFLANNFNLTLFGDWRLNFVNIGVTHQSNGRGDDLERSWNRAYLETILANNNWMISIKPWVVFNDTSLKSHNSDIARYMGYDRVLIAYKYNQQVFSLEKTNIERGFQRGAIQVTWSFPLVSKVKGYVQYFNGYGQSLLEYNHRTNNVGVGIALNDWL